MAKSLIYSALANLRGERGSLTIGFLEYHKIFKWLYISHL